MARRGLRVEVSLGSADYTNPDALVPKWARLGEGETFVSPILAVEAAVRICEAWRRDGGPTAQIGHGATGGATMPFDACTYEEAREWAVKREEELPFCDRCGEILSEEHYTHPELEDQKFCRGYCAEEAYEEALAQEPMPGQVCDSCLEKACDNGIRGRGQQALVMMELGADLEDHLCDVTEAPELKLKCECACRRR